MVFLKASSRVALLPMSALNHASMSARSKLPQWVCRRESRSCCVMSSMSWLLPTIRFLRHGFGSCVCPVVRRSTRRPTTRRGRQVRPVRRMRPAFSCSAADSHCSSVILWFEVRLCLVISSLRFGEDVACFFVPSSNAYSKAWSMSYYSCS